MKTIVLKSKLPRKVMVFNPGWVVINLTFSFLTCFAVATQGQTKLWDKTLGGSSWDDLQTGQQTADGGYILGGSSYSGVSGDKTGVGKGESDYWVVKLNADGSKAWDKTLGGSSWDDLQSLQQTNDGGYILGGTSYSGVSGDKTAAGKGEADYWVVKLNADGTTAWDKTLGGSKADELFMVKQTSEGGYILGGYSFSGKSGNKTEANKGYSDYWVVKLNADGTKAWDKTFGGIDFDGLQFIQQTNDSGYILGGYSNSGISGDKTGANKGEADYWVIKLNANGTKAWDKTFGGSNNDLLQSVHQTSDGGYILGGFSNSSLGLDITQANNGGWDYWVVKLQANGTKTWDNTFGGSSQDILSSVQETSDGGYILGGYSDSNISGNKTEASKGYSDYWMVSLTTDGTLTSDKTLGGSNFDDLQFLQPTSDGNYIVGGHSYSGASGDKTGANQGESDYWIIKIQANNSPVASTWNMRYGGRGNEGFAVVIKTVDGGYLSGGNSPSGISGDKTQSSQGKNDYWIVKSDLLGNKLWDKRYGGSGDDYLSTIIQTLDGGYLLGGSSLSGADGDKSQASRGDRDYWIVKIDAQGNQQWDKRYGGSGYDELKKIRQYANGNFILAGNSSSSAGGDKSQGSRGGQDYWLVKINQTGTKIWDKRYGGSLEETLEGASLMRDGSILLGGSSASGISGDKSEISQGGMDYWLIRLDVNGNKVWDKRFGGTGEDNLMGSGIAGTNTGNFFIAGHSTSGSNGDKSQPSQGGKDFWMLKINSNGVKLWDKRFGGSGNEGLRTIMITSDGGYLLGGRSESGISGDKTQDSRGGSDYWMVKTSSTGVKQWDSRYGGRGYEEIRTVLTTSDGGYLLGGRSDSGVSGDRTQPSQGGNDYWLIKVAAPSQPTAAPLAKEFTTKPVVNQASTELVKSLSLNAYPNPFSEQVTVSFSVPETQAVTIKVYNNQGAETVTLFQAQAQAHQIYNVKWQVNKQAAGVYLLQLQTPIKRQQNKLLLVK
ncbi:T9SS type A sorting domain-containing protein [Adhaeribacter pallidiroseus]|uniref:Secretion system C-terminal sorting domain-containing protein n=1 Tax=Adhaeribacter pallidiroseus TaxID=2072847 RepID=A0A369QS12_9BACT|nr:T9SS type A sorting domain-containing protein [Adhaeribacter pallidiroseus]RDC66445.1 hypothetical protein AHMF7616_05076 [Adhaeribacter pallidiroseus]